MSYKTQLHPWCIISRQANMRQTIIARFRRRSDADCRLQILRQLHPNAPHSVIFDVTPDNPDENIEAAQ